jgi:hypothetical protein
VPPRFRIRAPSGSAFAPFPLAMMIGTGLIAPRPGESAKMTSAPATRAERNEGEGPSPEQVMTPE